MCRRKRRVVHLVKGAAASALGVAGVEPYPRPRRGFHSTWIGCVGTLAPDSLLWRINSLIVANSFPVVVELVPCSVAQGIFGESSSKLLDSQSFSRWFFA